MRILIIDDDPDQRTALGCLLRALGHEVAVADSGAHAVAVAPAFQPEVVFLDFQMPSMNGYQVARALRRLAFAAPPRIVMLTGAQNVTLEDAQVAGCDAFARKPAPMSALLAAMHAAACSQVQELRHRA